MTAAQLVQGLRASGVRVGLKGSSIRTLGHVPSRLAGRIRENRDHILEFLRAEEEILDEKLIRARWCTIRSRLLGGETFLLVMAEEHLEVAKEAHPDMTAYLVEEALDLIDREASDDTLRAVHRIKQKLGGHVVLPT